MCLVGVVIRRYIHFLILLIPTPLVSALFGSSIPTFLFIFVIIIYRGVEFHVLYMWSCTCSPEICPGATHTMPSICVLINIMAVASVPVPGLNILLLEYRYR